MKREKFTPRESVSAFLGLAGTQISLAKILTGIVAAVILLAAPVAQGALIAYWDFPSSTGTSPFSADAGSQQSTATLEASGFSATLPAGTTVNQVGSAGATFELSYSGITARTLTLKLSGTGLENFVVTYAGMKGGPGGQNVAQLWEYSIDNGGNWLAVGVSQPGNLPTSFAVQTADFSSVSAIEGASSVWFRLTETPTHSGNTFGLDNFQINASTITPVPEPINVALASFGLCVVSLGVGRKIYRRARA